MIPEEQLTRARELLQNASRPLFLHDDDGDGVCSFVQCYQFCGDGRSVPVKNSPLVDEKYIRKVEENAPDLVVILDKPQVSQEFFDAVRTPILWIDHHAPQEMKHPNLLYLNPRIADDTDNRPTSYWVYQVTRKNLWIATLGCVSDWYLPEFIGEFNERWPHLLPEQFSRVEELYLDTPLGQLIRVLQFNLKGQLGDVRRSVMTLARCEQPDEILHQTTSRGRLLWRKYRKLAEGYERILAQAQAQGKRTGKLLVFLYEEGEQTYTVELSNELLIRFPEKVTIVGRLHQGKYKCSLRSKDVELPSRVEAALQGLRGRGGGHTNACGLVVEEEDWPQFYERFAASL